MLNSNQKINLKQYLIDGKKPSRFRVIKIIVSILLAVLIISTYIFGIYAKNLQSVNFSQVLTLYYYFLLVDLAIFLATLTATRNINKAGLITSAIIIWFFYYQSGLKQFTKYIKTENLLNNYWLIWSILFFILIILICFFIKKNYIISTIVFVSVVYLLINQAQQSVKFVINNKPKFAENSLAAKAVDLTEDNKQQNLPDVYYIILDAYGRNDILNQNYKINNSEFTNFLTSKRFYVANKAHSNYTQTELSLSSSLNMTYLDDLNGLKHDNRAILDKLIRDNKVSQIFKAYNYQFINFATGFAPTEFENSEIFVKPKNYFYKFDTKFLKPTFYSLHMDKVQKENENKNKTMIEKRYKIRVDTIGNIFKTLPKIAKKRQPKFVFAHLLVPHPPFVFGQKGIDAQTIMNNYSSSDGKTYYDYTKSKPEDYQRRYANQLKYVNQQMKSVIDQILANSKKPPVIILQADHGPGSMLDFNELEATNLPERLSILNAYYFPDQNYKKLYPEITPVNSFRLVFSQYFGLKQELLPDKEYYARWKTPYIFTDISDQLNSK